LHRYDYFAFRGPSERTDIHGCEPEQWGRAAEYAASGPDVFHAASGPDVFHAASGADVFHAASGADVFHAASGADVFHAASGADVFHAASGADVFHAASGAEFRRAIVHAAAGPRHWCQHAVRLGNHADADADAPTAPPASSVGWLHAA